jgi:hypothetical protein
LPPELLPPRPNSLAGPSSSGAEAGEDEAVEAPLTRDLESRRMWTSLSTRLAAAALRIAARLRSPAIGMVTHTTGGARVRAACGRASQAARLHHSSRRRPPPLSYSTSPSLQLLPSVSAREKEEGGGLDERKRGGDWGTGGRRRHGNQPCWSRVFTIHATTTKESDADERLPLPLAAGPA